MLSSLSSQPADVEPYLPPRALLSSVLTNTNTQRCSAPAAPRAELPGRNCCWAFVLLIAGVYTNALLAKVTPVQDWLKWKLVYYAYGSSCRQLIEQPAVARCLLEILWDAASKGALDDLQLCLLVGSARLGVLFVTVGQITPHQCTQGCSLSSPLVCGALQGEDAPLVHLELGWHWGGLILNAFIYQDSSWFSLLCAFLIWVSFNW